MMRDVTRYNQPAHRCELPERLRNLKMREGEGFYEFYCSQFFPVYTNLVRTGRKLDVETRIFLLLNALPNSWSAFVEVKVLYGLDTFTVDGLVGYILQEERTGEIRTDTQTFIRRYRLDRFTQLPDVRLSVSRMNRGIVHAIGPGA